MTSRSTLHLFILLFITNCFETYGVYITRFPIGGLFNAKTPPDSKTAFDNVVKMGSTKVYHGRAIHPQVLDSYSTALELCTYTSENSSIVALIDARPTNGICDITCLICNKLNISHLTLGWEPPATLENDQFTYHYHPPPEIISKAYTTLIKKLQWDKFTFLYEDDGSFLRLQELINSWPHEQDQILYRKLNPKGDNREIFKYIFKVVHMSYHVLDCDVKNIRKYMEEIVDVENSTQYQSFILTSLDAYTVELKDIPKLRANVSTLHLTKPNDVRWKDIGIDDSGSAIGVETALAVDALNHLEIAIRSLGIDTIDGSRKPLLTIPNPPPLCFRNSKEDYEFFAWPLGDKLREALLQTTSQGFTGHISFDNFGKRKDFVLYHSKLSADSQFMYGGYWDSKTDILTQETHIPDRSSARSNSVIRIVAKAGKPYFELDESNATAVPRGYSVDLMKQIFEQMSNASNNREEYKYEFYRVAGDRYGNPIAGTRKWDGLIGELLEHNAEFAVGDITITSERNAVVDFSTPFMSLGISLLTKVPDPIVPDMFSFIKPLSLDVWLYLATTYIIVSIVLLICARMSQGDWVNPHPCNQNPENLQNIWSLYNCMWLTMGAIMTQGCDILPRAAGSRWVAGMWWFFALILTASYTANMSTFLRASRQSTEITDVNDLVDKSGIAYGALYNGSTYKFFEDSNDSLYMKLWSVMKSTKPPVFTNSNDEGRDRVQKSKGKYAFFMESSAIEYYMQRYCDLKMIGKLDSKDYGIAMPKNSPYKSRIDSAILALQESGKLSELKREWWEQKDNDANCQETNEKEVDESGPLQMKNTSGIFLVLAMGGVIGFIVAIIDFILHAKKISVKEKVTFKEALASEWHASLNPRVLHKPAAPPRSAAPSTATPSPQRERSQSRAVSVLRAASSFINFDEIY